MTREDRQAVWKFMALVAALVNIGLYTTALAENHRLRVLVATQNTALDTSTRQLQTDVSRLAECSTAMAGARDEFARYEAALAEAAKRARQPSTLFLDGQRPRTVQCSSGEFVVTPVTPERPAIR